MILYLNNYKGFDDVFIPIREVNFFVGENSTGKTSILKLLEILSSPRFWIDPVFNTSEVELGYFSEIVNKISGNGKSFSLGVSYDNEEENDRYNGFFWMKFIEKDSTPMLSEFKFIIDNVSVWCFNIKEASIEYRTKNINNNVLFKEWVKDFNYFDDNEKSNIRVLPNSPFYKLYSEIENKIKGNKHDGFSSFITPRPYNRFYWIAPIRAKAKRWYESYKLSYSPEGDHTPLLLYKILTSKSKKSEKYLTMLREFGEKSGLFDDVTVNGAKKEKPFALQIHYGKLSVNLTNVGYGVSQVLPLLVELVTSQKKSFAIQQPEVHLHPKAQAAFGDFIFQIASKNKNRLILETHSEYMINRFRYALSTNKAKLKAQVLYFKRDVNGTRVYELPINSKGRFEGDNTTEYMKFFLEEELRMLEI